jgi:formylglycine-generating enzyme required for sulfatase activity
MGRSEASNDACPGGQACPDAETPEHPASVSAFELDVFEVTVSRFRAFLEQYDTFSPPEGSGAHPRIADSGWQRAWDSELPDGQSEFESVLGCDADASYTTEPSDNDTLPINCVTWFEAFAFCVYSGGRLPTEAEWEYAAAGGAQERLYPWGDSQPTSAHARFFPQDLDRVGAAHDGAARWGHHDFAGNVWEWALDWLDSEWYSGNGSPCDDCARLGSGSYRVLRGGAYSFEEVTLRAATRSGEMPLTRQPFIGVRCAASP